MFYFCCIVIILANILFWRASKNTSKGFNFICIASVTIEILPKCFTKRQILTHKQQQKKNSSLSNGGRLKQDQAHSRQANRGGERVIGRKRDTDFHPLKCLLMVTEIAVMHNTQNCLHKFPFLLENPNAFKTKQVSYCVKLPTTVCYFNKIAFLCKYSKYWPCSQHWNFDGSYR